MIKVRYHDSNSLLVEVTQRMGREVSERVWKVLEKRGDVAETCSGKREVNWLTERVWDLLELAGERVSHVDLGTPRDAKVARGDTQAVVSLAAAYAAAQQDDVVKFRKSVLGGKLMTLEEV